MSMRERAWRVVAPAVATTDRLPRRSSPHRFDRGPWPEAVLELAAGLNATMIDEAARIADGELCFWGRSASVDPAAPDWRLDPLTRTAVPWRHRDGHYDPKPLWELHRHQHLFPLAAGAHLADRPDWREVAVSQLRTWIAANPRKAGGPGWSSAYETAHRLVQWAWSVPLLARSLDRAARESIERAYAQQARFVATRPSRYSSANNHRIAEIVGLLHSEALTGDPAGWRRRWGELEHHAACQMYPDGGSREQAAGYFLYVLEMLWVAGMLARSLGQELGTLSEQLRRRVAWAAAAGDADFEPPAFGDDAEDRILRLEYFQRRRARDIVDRAAALIEDELVLQPTRSVETANRSQLLESGLVVLRVPGGPQEARVAFDVGELGFGALAAHGHADALSVVVENRGRTLLRDSGTGSYVPGEGRELLRSTAAHNTVEIGGVSQAVPLGPHLWGHRYTVQIEHTMLSAKYDYVRANHDGYVRDFGAVHRRSVLFLKPDFVVVLDRVEADRPQDIRLYWHLMSDTHLANLGSDASLLVATEPPASAVEEPFRYSPRYNSWSEAPRWSWHVSGTDVRFASVIALATGPHRLELRRAGDADEIVVEGPTPFRLSERWHGAPEISA